MPATSPFKAVLSTVKVRARDALLLEGALRQVRATPVDRQALVRAYHDAALGRTSVADQLTDEHGAVSGLILYREALPLLVAAIGLARDPAFDPELATNGSPWNVLPELVARGALPPLPDAVDEARAILTTSGALALDGLPASSLLARRATVARAIRELRHFVEPRSLGELKSSRFARVGFALLVAVAALGGLVCWATFAPNIALHKPVTVSSRHPGSIAPVDNSGLVNGEFESTYGVHTAPAPSWVMVDLTKIEKLSEIRIFNRSDTLFDAGLPFTLELSRDGVTFTSAERRTLPFSVTSPWVYKAPSGTRARYVRVRSNSFVALTEIEVY
jgi:hypothetical protein